MTAPNYSMPPDLEAEMAAAMADGFRPEPLARRQVWISNRNPVEPADEVVSELISRNEPPTLFRMGEITAKVLDDGRIEAFDNDKWLLHVARQVDFLTVTKDGPKIVNVPVQVLRIVQAAAPPYLPVLDAVVHTPYLDQLGNVVQDNGYNTATNLVLHKVKVTLPAIPMSPSKDELEAAVALLLEDWLADFPFDAESSKANMIAVLLTLTGRAFFGLAPLTVIDASTPGSGKGLLITTTSLIVEGEHPHFLELPDVGEEQRKKVTTALLAGHDLVVWDEAHNLMGRTLAMILTAENYSDRLLGGNKMLSVKNRFTQVALGNNVKVWGDLKRRVMAVRLEPDQEHPEHRRHFRHPHLEDWVLEHRGELLGAVLTIWRAWIAQGRPKGKTVMGSFEHWSRAVGGALENAGIVGFLENTADWLDGSEDDDGGWIAHLDRLAQVFGELWFTSGEVADAVLNGTIHLPDVKRDPDKSLSFSIGNAYRSVRGRVHGDYRLEASKTRSSSTGGRQWRVTKHSQDRQNPQSDADVTDDPDATDSRLAGSEPDQPWVEL